MDNRWKVEGCTIGGLILEYPWDPGYGLGFKPSVEIDITVSKIWSKLLLFWQFFFERGLLQAL